MKAIASGDFSSMIGTWQDAKGNSYTFDESGIESDVAKLETGDYSGQMKMGFTEQGFVGKTKPVLPFSSFQQERACQLGRLSMEQIRLIPVKIASSSLKAFPNIPMFFTA